VSLVADHLAPGRAGFACPEMHLDGGGALHDVTRRRHDPHSDDEPAAGSSRRLDQHQRILGLQVLPGRLSARGCGRHDGQRQNRHQYEPSRMQPLHDRSPL
jgi:hypothetical protein